METEVSKEAKCLEEHQGPFELNSTSFIDFSGVQILQTHMQVHAHTLGVPSN